MRQTRRLIWLRSAALLATMGAEAMEQELLSPARVWMHYATVLVAVTVALMLCKRRPQNPIGPLMTAVVLVDALSELPKDLVGPVIQQAGRDTPARRVDDPQSARGQKIAEARGGEALAQRGGDAPGDEDVPRLAHCCCQGLLPWSVRCDRADRRSPGVIPAEEHAIHGIPR